jgi:hypothetical protein
MKNCIFCESNHVVYKMINIHLWQIECKNCGALGPKGTTAEIAKHYWNKTKKPDKDK